MDRAKLSEIRNRAKGAGKGTVTYEESGGAHTITVPSRSHIRFFQNGPADVEALLDYIAEISKRNAVLESHLQTFEGVLKERDALCAENRRLRPVSPEPIGTPE
jgi:hypothetical protein